MVWFVFKSDSVTAAAIAAMPTHSSASSQQSQYEIPRELQEVLLDFTVHYLIEQPADLIRFAQDYFNRLEASRPPPTDGAAAASVAPSVVPTVTVVADNHADSQNNSDDDESMLSDDDIASKLTETDGMAPLQRHFPGSAFSS